MSTKWCTRNSWWPPAYYVWFSQFWSHFHGTMHCLPQRLKSTLFEIFSNGGCPKGTRSVEKISNNVDFSLWGNRATTWEYFLTFSSETKIMKITHSAYVVHCICLLHSLQFFNCLWFREKIYPLCNLVPVSNVIFKSLVFKSQHTFPVVLKTVLSQ